jgi:uncharacterized membrane protein
VETELTQLTTTLTVLGHIFVLEAEAEAVAGVTLVLTEALEVQVTLVSISVLYKVVSDIHTLSGTVAEAVAEEAKVALDPQVMELTYQYLELQMVVTEVMEDEDLRHSLVHLLVTLETQLQLV